MEIDDPVVICLIHKHEMIDWCEANKEILKGHFLCGTGTTARMITEATGLPVKGYNSGPLGGDQQIGAKIVEGRIDFVVFFSDPLTAQPHDPDVKALLRIAQVYDIPIANNRATADFLISLFASHQSIISCFLLSWAIRAMFFCFPIVSVRKSIEIPPFLRVLSRNDLHIVDANG